MDRRDGLAAAGLLAILGAILLGAATAGDPLAIDGVAARLGEAEARFWIAVTRIGDAPTRIVAGLAIVAWLVRHRSLSGALALLSVCAIETVAGEWLKDVFARERPALVPHLDDVVSLSFPSGHAAHSATLFLFGAALVAATFRDVEARAALWVVAALVVVLIGVSRVMLGVHWPSDVIGGWLFGAGFAAIGWAVHPLDSQARVRNNRRSSDL